MGIWASYPATLPGMGAATIDGPAGPLPDCRRVPRRYPSLVLLSAGRAGSVSVGWTGEYRYRTMG